MKTDDPMFFTYAEKSGKKLKEYNQYHQYAETLPVYKDFYDSISSTYSKKTKKNNDDRLRKTEADRARKMALLEEDYQRNRNYVNMHREELREYRERMDSCHSKDVVHEKLRALYLRRPQQVGTPYVSSENDIAYDSSNDLFLVSDDFTNADNVEKRSREEIMEEAENRGISINHISCHRNGSIG